MQTETIGLSNEYWDMHIANAFELDAKTLRLEGKFDIANWAHEMAHAYRNGWANLVTMGTGLHLFRGLRYSTIYMNINGREVIREYTPE